MQCVLHASGGQGAKVTEHIPWIAAPLHQLGLHSHMLLGLALAGQEL